LPAGYFRTSVPSANALHRTREIGIRVAIRARRSNVFALVMQRTVSVLGVGILCGTATALAASCLFGAVLYGISPKDPVTYLIAIALMIAITLLACVIPLHNALAVDPACALREE